ncbi:hypothetical protein P692DRAFT_20820482 [Suillus brevipes Sb2]|nr:hypothetical protein P692DRAFT_20820482 [Suillus brevipes Sb2]
MEQALGLFQFGVSMMCPCQAQMLGNSGFKMCLIIDGLHNSNPVMSMTGQYPMIDDGSHYSFKKSVIDRLTVVVTTSFTATSAAPSVAHISNDISDEDGEDSEDENLGIAAVDMELPNVTDGIVQDILGLAISNNATTGGGEDIMEELTQEDREDFAKEWIQEDKEDFTQELVNVPASSEESDSGHDMVPFTTGLGLPEGKKGTYIRSKAKPYIPSITPKYTYFYCYMFPPSPTVARSQPNLHHGRPMSREIISLFYFCVHTLREKGDRAADDVPPAEGSHYKVLNLQG